MKICLIRHGETYGNQGERRYIGRTSYSLTPKGREQIAQNAEILRKHLPYGQGRILSSTSNRCMESAGILARALGYEVLFLDALEEIHMGNWENRTFREIQSQYPVEYAERGENLAGYVVPGGESFQMVQERAVNVLRSQIKMWNQEDKPLLVMTHSGVIRCILSLCNDTPLGELMQYKISAAQTVELNEEQIRRLVQ